MSLPKKKEFDEVIDARKGMFVQPMNLVADDAVSDSDVTGENVILPGITTAIVTGVTNDANDFIVLPALSDVPDGFMVTVVANASSNFEVRTPATSAEEINSEDCDGTDEYLVLNTELATFRKVNGSIGWEAQRKSQVGAPVGDTLVASASGAGALGTGTIGAPKTYRRIENGTIITTIKVDITGLSVLGTQAKDAIGLASGAAYIGTYLAATYGIVFRIEMSCVEAPGEGTSTITQDIDLGADGDATIVQADGDPIDDIIVNTATLVAGETVVNNVPALTEADSIYLIEGDTAASTGVYNAGQFIIKFYGHQLLT